MHVVSLPGFGSTLVAVVLFAFYLIPPGFLVARWTNVAGFHLKSASEKLLWSVVLSFPVSTMIAVLLGHMIDLRVCQFVFVLLAVAATVLALQDKRKGLPGRGFDWQTSKPLIFALLAAGIFCLAASAPVLVRGHLEEGIVINDWYVRLPLQFVAGQGAVPSINPFFTIDGHSPVLHYYYFFYVLCAMPMRLAGLDARSTLSASTVWAMLMFFGVAWLMLKYLVLPAAGPSSKLRPRSQALLFMGVSLIAGLDLIPNVTTLLLGGRLFPTLFWWNYETVTPWPGTIPFVPHHYVGLATAMLGYMLLVRGDMQPEAGQGHEAVWTRTRLLNTFLAAICFASALGTSTFVAAGVFFAVGVLAADALILQRRYPLAVTSAASVVIAIAIDSYYVAATFLTHDAGSATRGGKFPLKLVMRYWHLSYGLTWGGPHPLLKLSQTRGLRDDWLSVPLFLVIYVIELGFFWFVLWYQARKDLRATTLQPEGRALWVLVLTFAVLTTFVSSSPMQHGLNDFGRHTAMALHFTLMLLACPLVAGVWRRYRSGEPLAGSTRLAYGVAALFAVIGLAGTAWDVTVQRIYLPMIDQGLIRPMAPFLFTPGIGADLEDLRQMWAQIGRITPSDAVVQANPDGKLSRPVLLYLNRRVAAGDNSCEASFGGDVDNCLRRNVLPLLGLYGDVENTKDSPELVFVTDVSPQAFVRTCASLHLTALIATDQDYVWHLPDSWVWQEPSLFATPRVRLLACPTER